MMDSFGKAWRNNITPLLAVIVAVEFVLTSTGIAYGVWSFDHFQHPRWAAGIIMAFLAIQSGIGSLLTDRSRLSAYAFGRNVGLAGAVVGSMREWPSPLWAVPWIGTVMLLGFAWLERRELRRSRSNWPRSV